MDKFRSRNHKEKEERNKEKAKRIHEETHANKSVGEEQTPSGATGNYCVVLVYCVGIRVTC